MASGDVSVQNSRSISGRPRRATVAAAPALLASLDLHGARTTSQIDGTTGAQAKLLAARKGLGVEDGWRDSDRCGDLQEHNIPVGAMRSTKEPAARIGLPTAKPSFAQPRPWQLVPSSPDSVSAGHPLLSRNR
jgi:hypothetical protein